MNKSQQVVKAYSTDNTVEAKLTEGINQANKLTLSVPLKDRLDSNIFYALIPTDDSTNYLMFKLNDESIENNKITYTGIDAAYDELRGYAYIKEIRPVNRTAKEILQLILKDTRWEVGYIDSSTPTNTFFYYQSVLECIQQVVKLFNVEVTFTYSFNTKTHEITARNVNVYKQQGRRTGKRFEYGSNLLTVTREEDSQDIVTALVGRGKGEEKLDDDTGEATGGYGRRINFKDVVWSKANGDPADKPAGQEYVENPEATKIFGYDDGTPRTGIVVFEDIEDPVELLKATWASLLGSCRPKVGFKASVTDVGDLRLGDTIAIIRHDLGIEYFTRVFKVVRDLKDEQNNTVEMGDDLSQNTLTSYVTDISNTANQAVQQANDAVVSAGSKNKTFYSATKPRIASEGDNLYLSLDNGEFEYWVWHNNQWQFIQSTQELNVVKQNVKQAQDDIKKTNEDLEKSKEDFNKSFGDLGESVVNFKGSLNDLDKEVKANTKNISDNYTTVVGKISYLGQTSVNKGEFSQLSQTVKGISTSVENNSSDISTLKQTAEGLQTQVSDNSDKLITINQTVNGVKVTAEDGIEKYTELSQTVDGLKSKVDQGINQSEIQQLKDQIGLKVSKGDVVSELNLEAGRALISSNKIVLDADSVIFNGKAFIPDAAISGISADKINTGTLDAGKINVININADNIHSGTIIGNNSSWNLATGFLNIGDADNYVSIHDGQINLAQKKQSAKSYFSISQSLPMKDDPNLLAASVSAPEAIMLTLDNNNLNKQVDWDPYLSNDEYATLKNKNKGILVTKRPSWAKEGSTYPGVTISGGDQPVVLFGGDASTAEGAFSFLKTVPAIRIGTSAYGLTDDKYDSGKRPNGSYLLDGIQIEGHHLNVNTVITSINGDLTVGGSKNAVVPTSQGMAAINAYETAEYYFGDIGKSKTDETMQVIIKLDPLFLETVNTEIPYHVFVSSYSDAHIWVEQMSKDSFVVKSSKPNAEFSWEIKAKRLGYEDNRLKITQKDIPKELIPQYKEKGIM